MKGNYTSLNAFKAEIQRVEDAKNDYLVAHHQLMMAGDNKLVIHGVGAFHIKSIAHQQIAEKFGIPKRYYDAMEAVHGLRGHNVNQWLRVSGGEKKLIRVLDGNNRAFLSDCFVPLDHKLVVDCLMPAFEKRPEVQIKSQSLTEKKMYLQVVFPSIQAEIKVGDIVQSGLTITNSEVGWGALNISRTIWRLKCQNGMTGSTVMSKWHIGRQADGEIEDYNIYQAETIKAQLSSIAISLKRIFTQVLTQAFFDMQVQKLKTATKDEIKNPLRVVENVTKRFKLTQDEKEGVLGQFMIEDDMTRWGLGNALTAMAKQVESPDRQFEFEKIGNDLIELNRNEWEEIKGEV